MLRIKEIKIYVLVVRYLKKLQLELNTFLYVIHPNSLIIEIT